MRQELADMLHKQAADNYEPTPLDTAITLALHKKAGHPDTQRFSWQGGKRVENPNWKDTTPPATLDTASMRNGVMNRAPLPVQSMLNKKPKPPVDKANLRNGVIGGSAPLPLRDMLKKIRAK